MLWYVAWLLGADGSDSHPDLLEQTDSASACQTGQCLLFPCRPEKSVTLSAAQMERDKESRVGWAGVRGAVMYHYRHCPTVPRTAAGAINVLLIFFFFFWRCFHLLVKNPAPAPPPPSSHQTKRGNLTRPVLGVHSKPNPRLCFFVFFVFLPPSWWNSRMVVCATCTRRVGR